jgi:delta24(24(1))-sterol reductase
VETPRPRRPNRRKSPFGDDEGDDSSSQPESSSGRSSSARIPARSVSASEKPAASNGSAKKATNGTHKSNGAGKKEVIDGWEVGTDPKIDQSGHIDFGGSFGVSAMMVGFPLLMYYMWIGATFYDGKFPTPTKGQTLLDFFKHLAGLVSEFAFPSVRAWTIYWVFFIFEGACYCLLPGVETYGKPLAHEGGKQLRYYCSGVWSFYTTIVITAVLHYTGVFPLYTIIDEFGPLLSVAILSGYLVSIIAYFSALARGAQHRMTGYPIYDFFMGAELNPRMFGILDFKMFFEVRLPWFILLGLSCATAARQYEDYGYVSPQVAFLVMAHFLYANACCKGEECITTTW